MEYQKGHLRDVVLASNCRYLKPNMLLTIRMAPVEKTSSIATPGHPDGKQWDMVPVIDGRPRLGFVCLSQQMYDTFVGPASSEIKEQIPLGNTETTLDFCRGCPCYEKGSDSIK